MKIKAYIVFCNYKYNDAYKRHFFLVVCYLYFLPIFVLCNNYLIVNVKEMHIDMCIYKGYHVILSSKLVH